MFCWVGGMLALTCVPQLTVAQWTGSGSGRTLLVKRTLVSLTLGAAVLGATAVLAPQCPPSPDHTGHEGAP